MAEDTTQDAETLLEKVIDHFGELLISRLELGVFTTEDSVRYTFFAALLETSDIRPEGAKISLTIILFLF